MDPQCCRPQDSTSSLGTTLTGGIQDVSALLPLLGTEQCENHIGSALVGGYLYAAAAPLSIFGSLGIARCGAKAAAASCNLELWGNKFMGAEKVADAGFSGGGKVLSLIMWDGRRHLAETQFAAMLEQLHITNVAGLSVEATTWSWNLKMLGVSFIAAVTSLVPYIYLFKTSGGPFTIRWLLPLARSMGSLVTANLTQIIIQARLLEIIRHRIAFLAVNDNIRDTAPDDLPQEWHNSVASEVALYHLKAYLNAQPGGEKESGFMPPHTGSGVREDEEKGDGCRSLDDLEAQPSLGHERKTFSPAKAKQLTQMSLKEIMKKQLPPATKTRRSMLILVRITILLGLGFSVMGYIGSFSLVQSATSTHALIWLTMEVILSLVRISLWSWNPDGDDTALTFTLKLTCDSPLPTCNKFSDELVEEKVVPLTRSRDFLGEVTSFVGLLEPLEGIGEGVALYYTMTVREQQRSRALYVTMFDYKERISRTLVYWLASNRMICYASTIEVQDGKKDGISRVEAILGEEVPLKGHHLTGELSFGVRIKKHCLSILYRLAQNRGAHVAGSDVPNNCFLAWFTKHNTPASDPDSEKINRTWSLKKPNTKPASASGPIEHVSVVNDNSTLEEEKPIPAEDWAYLQVGKLERLRRRFCLERNQWVNEYISLVTEETMAELPPVPLDLDKQNTQSITILCEAAVAEYLVLYEWESLERMLIDERANLEAILWTRSEVMIGLLRGRGDGPVHKISDERRNNIERRISLEGEMVRERSMNFAERARRRINQRKYRGPTGNALENCTRSTEKAIQQAWAEMVGSVEELQSTPESPDQRSTSDEQSIAQQQPTPHPVSSRFQEFTAEAEEQIRKIYEVTLAEIERFPQPDEKQLNMDEFKEVKARSYRRQWWVNKRLSDEWCMMVDRLNRLREELATTQRNHEEPKLPQVLHTNNDAEFIRQSKQFKGSSFVAYLALSRNAKHIQLLHNTLQENGVAAITWALERNSIASSIDCTGCSPADALKLVSSLKKPRNITILLPDLPEVTSSHPRAQTAPEPGELSQASNTLEGDDDHGDPGSSALSEDPVESLTQAIMEQPNIFSIVPQSGWPRFEECKRVLANKRAAAIPSKQDDSSGLPMLVFYEHVVITDYYRRGNPYLLFGARGGSRCVVRFTIPAAERSTREAEGRKLKLRLHHCRTTANGEVDICLNNVKVRWGQEVCPRDNFGFQDVDIDLPTDDANDSSTSWTIHELTITLCQHSEGVYWLSDVQLL